MQLRLDAERSAQNKFYEKINVEKIDIYDLDHLYNDMMERIFQNTGPLDGKTVIDLGAGTGVLSVLMAKKGADVISIDISDRACEIIKALAGKYGVGSKVSVINGSIYDIKVTVQADHVVCLNSLHHMLDEGTINGIYDSLKDGGQVAFIEPSYYNPFAWVFRRISKGDGRTANETPLKISDIRRLKSKFREVKVNGLYLLSSVILAFERMFRIGRKSGPLQAAYRAAGYLDDILLKVPGMKYFAWKLMIVGSR